MIIVAAAAVAVVALATGRKELHHVQENMAFVHSIYWLIAIADTVDLALIGL